MIDNVGDDGDNNGDDGDDGDHNAHDDDDDDGNHHHCVRLRPIKVLSSLIAHLPDFLFSHHHHCLHHQPHHGVFTMIIITISMKNIRTSMIIITILDDNHYNL